MHLEHLLGRRSRPCAGIIVGNAKDKACTFLELGEGRRTDRKHVSDDAGPGFCRVLGRRLGNLGLVLSLTRDLGLLYAHGVFPLRAVTALMLPENWAEMFCIFNARGPQPSF